MRLTLRLVRSGGELLQNKCFCDQLQSATQQREGGGDKQRVAVETGAASGLSVQDGGSSCSFLLLFLCCLFQDALPLCWCVLLLFPVKSVCLNQPIVLVLNLVTPPIWKHLGNKTISALDALVKLASADCQGCVQSLVL